MDLDILRYNTHGEQIRMIVFHAKSWVSGHIATNDRTPPDREEMGAVKNWPTPQVPNPLVPLRWRFGILCLLWNQNYLLFFLPKKENTARIFTPRSGSMRSGGTPPSPENFTQITVTFCVGVLPHKDSQWPPPMNERPNPTIRFAHSGIFGECLQSKQTGISGWVYFYPMGLT